MSSGSTLKQQDEAAAVLVAAGGDSPDDRSVHSAGGDAAEGSVGDAKEDAAPSSGATVVAHVAPGSLVTGSSSSSASSGEDDDDEDVENATGRDGDGAEPEPAAAPAATEEEEEGEASGSEEEEGGDEEIRGGGGGLFADIPSPVSSRWEALSRQPSATVASEEGDPAGRLPVAVQTAVVSGDLDANAEEEEEEEDDDAVLAWMHRCLDYTAKTPSRVEVRSLMSPEGIMTVRRPVQSLPRLGGDGGVFAPRTGVVAWLEEEGSGRVDRLMQVISRTDPAEERAMLLHKRASGAEGDAAPAAAAAEAEEAEEAASEAMWGVPSVVPRDAPSSVGLGGAADMGAVRRSFRLMHWLTLASGGEAAGIGDSPPFSGSHCPVDMAKLALSAFDGERSRGSLLHACAVVQWALQQDPDATATMAAEVDAAAAAGAASPAEAAEGEGILTDSHLSLRSFDRLARLQEEAALAGAPLAAGPNGPVDSVQWATAAQAANHGAPEAATRLVRMLPFLHERIVADTLLQLLLLDHRASAAGGAGDQAPAGGGPGAQMAAMMLGTTPDRSGPGAVFKREQDEADDASVRTMLDAFAGARLAERLVWHLAGYGVLPRGWRLPEAPAADLQGRVPDCAIVVEPATAEAAAEATAAAAAAGEAPAAGLAGRRLWPSALTVSEHVSNAADVLIQLLRAWQTQAGAKKAFAGLLSDAVLPLLLWAALGVDADEQAQVHAALHAEGASAAGDGARLAWRVDPAREARRRAAMRVLLAVMELSGPETIKPNQDIQNVAGGFAEVMASLMAEPKENMLHPLRMRLVLPLASFAQPLMVTRIVYSHILSHLEEAAGVRGAGVAVDAAALDAAAADEHHAPRMSPTAQRHPGHETPAPFGTFRLSLLQLLLALLRSDARLCAKRLTGPALQVSAGLARVRFLETARLVGGGDPDTWTSGAVDSAAEALAFSPVPRPPWQAPPALHEEPPAAASSDRSQQEWSGAWLWQCMLRWVEVYPQNSMLHGAVRSLLRLGLTLGVRGMPAAEGGAGAGPDTAAAVLQDLLERAAVTRWATRVWWSSMREPLRRAAQTHHAAAPASEQAGDEDQGANDTDAPATNEGGSSGGGSGGSKLPNLSAIPRAPTPRPRDRSDSLGLHSGLPSLTPVTPREHGGARFWGTTGSALAGAGRVVGRGLSGAAHVALSVLTVVRLAAEASDRSSALGRWVRRDPFLLLAAPYAVTLSRVVHTPLLGAPPESGQRQPNAKALRAMLLQAAGMPPEDDEDDDAVPTIKAGTPDPKMAVAVDGERMLREEVAELAKGAPTSTEPEGRLLARRFVCLSGPISNGDEAVWALQCAEALTLRREACLRSMALLPADGGPLVSSLDLGAMPLQLPGAEAEEEAEEEASHSRAPPTTPGDAAATTPPRAAGASGGSGRKKKQRRGRRGGKKARERTSSVGSTASSATASSAAAAAAAAAPATGSSAAAGSVPTAAAAAAAAPAVPSDLAPLRVPVACSLGSAIASEAGFRGVQPHHSWDEADAVSGRAERLLALWLQSALEDREDAAEAAVAALAPSSEPAAADEEEDESADGPPRDGWATIARPPAATAAAADEPEAAEPPASPERAAAADEFLDEID